MDDRGNTTKATYSSQGKRSIVAYALFASMFLICAGGGFVLYNFFQSPAEAAMFTPILSSPQSRFAGHCTVTPDAEDFATCSTDYETVADSQILRCPSGYGNVQVTKVRDGENGKKLYRDMALVRHFCKGMDNCEFSLAELRAADDGMPLEEHETHIDTIIIEPIEPEEIIDQVAGVDSNGHVLLKKHSHSRYPGKVKVYYECDKNEEDPFEALANFFEDILMSGTVEVVDEPATEEIGAEELPPADYTPADYEETPIVLSKKHGGCHKGLKNLADDWDAGAVCGTVTEEITLECDPLRPGARIFVMAVKPKGQKNNKQPTDGGADPVIDDTQETVENEPFLSKRHHRHGNKQGKQGKKQAKQLGWQLTDVCNAQAATTEGDGASCTVVLNEALGEGAFASDPSVTDTSPIHVKYMCSYEHQVN